MNVILNAICHQENASQNCNTTQSEHLSSIRPKITHAGEDAEKGKGLHSGGTYKLVQLSQ